MGKDDCGCQHAIIRFVLISGIAIWWPRTRKTLKNSLKISTKKGWKRFWYDLHVAGGMYSLIFLLAMSLTGLTWSFPWYRAAFYKVFGVEVQQRAAYGQERKGDSQKGDTKLALREGRKEGNKEHSENGHNYIHSVTSPFVYWQEVYDKLSRQNPEYKQISVASGTAERLFQPFRKSACI